MDGLGQTSDVGGGQFGHAPYFNFNDKAKFDTNDVSNANDNYGSLYFMDRGKGSFSKDGDYLYRLDLRQKFFDYLMQILLKREEVPSGKR